MGFVLGLGEKGGSPLLLPGRDLAQLADRDRILVELLLRDPIPPPTHRGQA